MGCGCKSRYVPPQGTMQRSGQPNRVAAPAARISLAKRVGLRKLNGTTPPKKEEVNN